MSNQEKKKLINAKNLIISEIVMIHAKESFYESEDQGQDKK